MTDRVKELSVAARQLPQAELADLVADLIDALDSSESWDDAWAAEAHRRLAAYRRGDVSTIPADEVLRRLGKP